MPTFDSDIIDKIIDILSNSKDLLDIKRWRSFELDFSTPVEDKNTIFQHIKNNIGDFNNVTGIYAIFDKDICLYIGKGKPVWSRLKSHFIAAKGLDKAERWTNFFMQYQKVLAISWIDYANLHDPGLDDKLRELFEHILQQKYQPLFESFK